MVFRKGRKPRGTAAGESGQPRNKKRRSVGGLAVAEEWLPLLNGSGRCGRVTVNNRGAMGGRGGEKKGLDCVYSSCLRLGY